MSAKIIPFPGAAVVEPDPLDRLAKLLSDTRGDLPRVNHTDEQLKLLRRIDRKLSQLVKVVRQGGVQ